MEIDEISDEKIASKELRYRRHEAMMMREHFMMMCEEEDFEFMPEMMFWFDEEEIMLSLKVKGGKP